MAIPKSKELERPDVMEILSLERSDITDKLLRDYFACHLGENAPRFNTYDTFTLPPGKLYNDAAIKTTVGRYIINLLVLPEKYLKKFGYNNNALSKGELEKIEGHLSSMVLNDELSTKEYAEYLDNGEWIGMNTVYFLSPTMDYEINLPIPEVIKRRDELFEKYKTEIDRGNSAVADKIEAELIKLAKEKIQETDNEAYDFFASKVGKFENNYKKTSIMGGAIQDPYTKKLSIIKSNYIDGVSMKEYAKLAALSLIGGYSRGIETQSSGYERKKIDNALQSVSIDEEDSDCKTPFTLKVTIPESLKNLFLYRYIKEGENLVELTEANINKYVGKEVQLRSPLFCKSEKICSKCAGTLYYKMGIRDIGLLNDNMSGVLMNASMKKFHDASLKFSKIEISDYIKKKN